MNIDERYMSRCIELAKNGAGKVSPNPMVGCVIVLNNEIIAEGWHRQFGAAHAEVNAIGKVQDQSLLRQATLYVNLEPCSHFGKTPPCADLIIKHQVKRVVIGMLDPFEKVAGNGIDKLADAGIETCVGVLEKECNELNKRFITFHTKKRPYVLLKWAQTQDGFIAPDATKMSAEEFEEKRHITGFVVQRLVHKWRTEEDAIMVGTRTIETDNPALNARAFPGKNPVRVIIDKHLRLPLSYKVFDGSQPTFVFTEKEKPKLQNVEFVKIDFSENVFFHILSYLHKVNIQSLIVEGGHRTLSHIFESNLWDEAQVFTAPTRLKNGIAAPAIPFSRTISFETIVDHKHLIIYHNHS